MSATLATEGKNDQTVRLSELLGALSYALDLTDGQPVGHSIRTTWIAVAVGERMGLSESQLGELYYASLLKDLGCSANAARICELYLTDELTIKRGFKAAGTSFPKLLGFVLSNTAPKSPLGERLRTILHLVQNGGKLENEIIQTRCSRGAQIAASLRFPPAVSEAIHSLDEHWNGGGHPDRLAGDAIPVYSRITLLAQVVDIVLNASGREAAVAEASARCGSWFDPAVVKGFLAVASDESFWSSLSGDGLEEAVFALAPGRSTISVDEDYLDDIARAFAQIIDSKSPFTSGHSERVAVYAEMVSAELGYAPERQRWIRRAALLHDIGKLGVSNAILDKNGKLDDEEWVQMRNHSSWSETILERVPVFKEMAVVGGAHHERLDGKGYPRGLKDAEIELDTRIVSVADVFDALTADRPYRAAMPVPKALGIMREDVGKSFDPACFAALERAIAGMEGELAEVKVAA